MSNRNRMPGLRLEGGLCQIEKRCKHVEGGLPREGTGTSSHAEAEDVLIRRLAKLKDIAERRSQRVFTFEEAALRYLEDIAHKPSAGTAAFHIDQVLPFIGDKVLAQVHDGTLKPRLIMNSRGAQRRSQSTTRWGSRQRRWRRRSQHAPWSGAMRKVSDVKGELREGAAV